MEKLNDIFDVEVAKTIDAYPSVFSKDDVIQLITRLRTDAVAEALEASRQLAEDERKFFISEMDFQEFSSNVCKALEREINNGGLDVYDYSSVEFSINYHNTIEIENLDFNTDAVTDELSNILLDQFQESFGKLLNSETEE
jgi:hypothetical protein